MTSPTGDGAAASDNQVDLARALVAGLLVAATLLLWARMYTRLLILKQTGLDDWTLVAAWVSTCAVGILTAVATQHGLGYHTSALPVETLIDFLRHLFALIIVYNIALTVVKVSFLLQYRRVFVQPRLRTTCNILLVIVVVWGLFQILMTVFFCKPIHGFWDVTIQAECQPKLPFWISNSVFNLLTDITIFALPLPSLRQLHLGKVQKRVLIGVFCLGFFTCLISIIRLASLKAAAVSTDPTFDNVSTACWSLTECVCGIICACVPSLRPLVVKAVPSLRTTGLGKTSQGYEMQRDTRRRNQDAQASKQESQVELQYERDKSSDRLDGASAESHV